MGRKRTPGLRKRGRIWHIQKEIRGFGTLNESTGETDLQQAEFYLAKRLEEIRRIVVYGERPREDRATLLGHRLKGMTTHYSAPDVARLLEAVSLLCDQKRATVLRIVGQKPGITRSRKAGVA